LLDLVLEYVNELTILGRSTDYLRHVNTRLRRLVREWAVAPKSGGEVATAFGVRQFSGTLWAVGKRQRHHRRRNSRSR
jgi:hypothetical protein